MRTWWVPLDEQTGHDAANQSLQDRLKLSVQDRVIEAIEADVSERVSIDVAISVDENKSIYLSASASVPDGSSVEQRFAAVILGRRLAQVSPVGQINLVAPNGAVTGPLQSHDLAASTVSEARDPTVSVGGAVALLGGVLVFVGAFVPIRSYGTLPIPTNSFVSDGDWWILAVALLIGVAALYFLLGAGRGRGWQVLVPSIIAVGAGIYALTSKFQTVPLTPLGQQLLGVSTVKTSAAVGVYLILAGGVIALIGGVMLLGATGNMRTGP
jgi:hypothetical protein